MSQKQFQRKSLFIRGSKRRPQMMEKKYWRNLKWHYCFQPLSKNKYWRLLKWLGNSNGFKLDRGFKLFSDEETQNHINVFELKAILFGLQSLARHIRLPHIKILCDNSTAVACINKFGTSHSGKCGILSKQIWKLAQETENWLSATHSPGTKNTEADLESRKNEVHTEWKLRENISNNICSQLNAIPKIDLFATRLIIAVSAFLLGWLKLDFYAFASFVCLNRVL